MSLQNIPLWLTVFYGALFALLWAVFIVIIIKRKKH